MMAWPDALVVLPVLIPLAAMALTSILRTDLQAKRMVMEAAVGLMLLASLALLAQVAATGTRTVAFGGWPSAFAIVFTVDRISAALASITGIVALAATVYARAEIRDRRRRAGFDPLFLAMIAAVNGAFLTGDLFNLYVWFELMLVTAMGLIAIDRRRSQIDGALRYGAMSILGASFILLGIGLLYGETGTLNLEGLSAALRGKEPSLASGSAAFLLLAGFGVKAGLFPLFFWLPASYHTAPVAASAAFAGLLTKVGFYACLRIFTLVFEVERTPGLQPVLALLAGTTMLIGVLAAAAQWDVRRILAFHIISQIGYMLMGLALATTAGIGAAIFYMVHHILVKTNLFFAAGAIGRASGTSNLKNAGGLMRAQPLFALLFAVPALSLAGIPPLSGFWAKLLVIEAGLRDSALLLSLTALGVGFLTLYSMTKIWVEAFWKDRRDGRRPRPVPPAMLLASGILGVLTVAIGLAVEPLIAFTDQAAVELTGQEPAR
ncbi:proton-conducting transporter transmembrane domain-containing protein [Geminicoccus roseus]|uniref:proton-conducting transporter transmembrane domain-containing protein n=1 Tax=Geminicoccus roseus TaxID=404900 RepID=UPI00041779C9|nr:proton-conducting transporter membrane subunit [Geminicoccus roseus]